MTGYLNSGYILYNGLNTTSNGITLEWLQDELFRYHYTVHGHPTMLDIILPNRIALPARHIDVVQELDSDRRPIIFKLGQLEYISILQVSPHRQV